MAVLLFILGFALLLIGGIWLLVVTFQESIGWGIGSILIPIVSLVFVIMHWDISKKPFLIQIAGLAVLILAGMISGPNRGYNP